MGLNRMMMKKGQSEQLYHLKSSYIQNGFGFTFLGFCAEEIDNPDIGVPIPPMGSLSPNEYCGTKIKNIFMVVSQDEGMGYFGIVDFYGKLSENATGVHGLLDFRIPQLNVNWTSITDYDESTNTTSCGSDEYVFPVDNLGSLENLYITIAPHVPVGGE